MKRRSLKTIALVAGMVMTLVGIGGCGANSKLPECFDEDMKLVQFLIQ